MALKNFVVSGALTAEGTLVTGQKSVIEVRSIKSTLSKDVTSVKVKGIKDGSDLVQNVATVQTEVSWTFEMSVADTDWQTLSVLFNEVPQTTTSYTDSVESFLDTVPLVSTYVISNALITSGLTVDTCQVSITIAGSWGDARPLEVITTGSPTADQVLLDAAGGDLTFASANAGAPVKVSVATTLATVPTIGVEADPVTFDGMSFYGIATSTNGVGVKEKYVIRIYNLVQEEGWSLEFGSPDGEKSLKFSANVEGSKRSPVELALIVE